MSQADADKQGSQEGSSSQNVPKTHENKTMSNVDSTSQLNGGHRPLASTIRSQSNTNLGLQLADLKSKRERVQKDVNMLHNRIRMLRLEEERAMKKIQETRK